MLVSDKEHKRIAYDLVDYVERFYNEKDLLTNSRSSKAIRVKMRKIIGKILRDDGYKWNYIGKLLKKHHTTIIDNYERFAVELHWDIYEDLNKDLDAIGRVFQTIKYNRTEFGHYDIRIEVEPRRIKTFPQLGFVKYGGSHKIHTDHQRNISYKKCSTCTDLVEIEGFNTNRANRSGLRTICIYCTL